MVIIVDDYIFVGNHQNKILYKCYNTFMKSIISNKQLYSKIIKYERIKQNLSQSYIAHATNTTQSSISKIEKEYNGVFIENYIKILELLGYKNCNFEEIGYIDELFKEFYIKYLMCEKDDIDYIWQSISEYEDFIINSIYKYRYIVYRNLYYIISDMGVIEYDDIKNIFNNDLVFIHEKVIAHDLLGYYSLHISNKGSFHNSLDSLKDNEYKAVALYHQSIISIRNNAIIDGINYLNRAQQIFKDLNYKYPLIRCDILYAYICYKINDTKKSIDILKECYEYANDIDKKFVDNFMMINYIKENDLSEVLHYLKKYENNNQTLLSLRSLEMIFGYFMITDNKEYFMYYYEKYFVHLKNKNIYYKSIVLYHDFIVNGSIEKVSDEYLSQIYKPYYSQIKDNVLRMIIKKYENDKDYYNANIWYKKYIDI